MSNPANCAPYVLRMLFDSILDVVKSAVLVVRSPRVLLRLPPAVMQTLLGSSFSGRKLITMRAHVTPLSSGMQSILSLVTLKMVFVPTVPVFFSPWAIQPKSLLISVCHSSLIVGSSLDFWYWVKNLFGDGMHKTVGKLFSVGVVVVCEASSACCDDLLRRSNGLTVSVVDVFCH